MKKIVRLTESELVDLIERIVETSKKEKEQINEQLVITAAILAYRQTAKSKSNRLTKKIKKALKDRGINNKVIQDGNFNKLMKCINSAVDDAGDRTKGGKHVNKSLVRNADLITTKKKKEKSEESLEEFERLFDSNIQYCSNQFKLSDETKNIIRDVMVDTIRSFQQKTFRL